jgi:hypothetical protein
MALLIECVLKCAPILIDNADIVREAIFRQLRTYSVVVQSIVMAMFDCTIPQPDGQNISTD